MFLRKYPFRLAVVFIPFALYSLVSGAVQSIKKQKGLIDSLDAIGLFLISELFVLGILHKYPFTGERITLFVAPFIFFSTVKGLNAVKLVWLRRALLVYFCCFCLACLGNTFWMHWQEVLSN